MVYVIVVQDTASHTPTTCYRTVAMELHVSNTTVEEP
jgi:hypothetical protein